jgi:opacity protein-like surface antigen
MTGSPLAHRPESIPTCMGEIEDDETMGNGNIHHVDNSLWRLGDGSAECTPAGSELTPGQWNVTPFAGFGFSGDLDSATGALGVAAGYNWSRIISLEGELNVLPSSENGGLVEVNSNAWSLTGNLLYHFAPRAFRPYGVIGVGFGHATVDVSPSTPGLSTLNSSSTEFVVNFGGGVERAIRENIHFRGDLRYFVGGDLVPDYWRVGAGLRFALGRR